MRTYVAFFRGINVGGNCILPMKELAAILENLGSRNVKTYIQSGNAVFRNKEQDATRLTNRIRAAVKKSRGFEPHVLLLEPEQLQGAIASNPFPDAETAPTTLHVFFLSSAPASPDLQKLADLKSDRERFVLKENVCYLHAPDGIGRSKLAAMAERLIGVPMTGRNWRTLCKVRDIASACD